jgi:hypothetical protein
LINSVLYNPIDGFSERIIMRIANRADRRINAGLDEPFGEPDRRVLAARIAVKSTSALFGPRRSTSRHRWNTS